MLPVCSAAPFATDLWVAVEMRMSQRDVNGLGRRGSAVNTSSVLQKAAKRQAAPRCSVRLSNCGAQLGPHQQQSCFCTACHEQRLLCRSPATAASSWPLCVCMFSIVLSLAALLQRAAAPSVLGIVLRLSPGLAVAALLLRHAPQRRVNVPAAAHPVNGGGVQGRQGGFIVYVRRAVHPRLWCRIDASVAASHAGSGARAQ